jgi:hypothetical protein
MKDKLKSKKGKGNFANMPQEVQMKPYPKNNMRQGGDLDDTITGIDKTIDRGHKICSKYVSNQK